MLKKLSSLSACIVLGFCFTPVNANIFDQKPHQFINQRGSTVNISTKSTDPRSGKITGTFTTVVANPDCQDVIGKPAPVIGSYVGNVLSLIVTYPTCGSVVSMAGSVEPNHTIETLWIVAHQGKLVESK